MFLFYNGCSQMAVKQGNQLQMQVHEGYHVSEECPPPAVAEKRPVPRAGKKPLAHYSSLVRVLGSNMKTPAEPAAQVWKEWPCLCSFSDLMPHCLWSKIWEFLYPVWLFETGNGDFLREGDYGDINTLFSFYLPSYSFFFPLYICIIWWRKPQNNIFQEDYFK